MKKNKGFTIPELLAVIVILGILMTVAIASYNGISKKVKENSLTQKINYLQEKAYEYASDNNVKSATISVAHLIELGYIAADHPENADMEKVDNPVNGEYLDCVTFDIEKDMDDYKVKTNLEGNCEVVLSEEREAKVTMSKYVKVNGAYQPVSDWVGQNVYVMVKLDSSLNLAKYPLVNNQITYTVGGSSYNKSGTYCTDIAMNDSSNCNNIYEVSTDLIYNNKVTATLEFIDREKENNTFKITKEAEVRIDKEKPNLKVTFNTAYTGDSVPVSLVGEDGGGSGIYGYYLSKNPLPNDATKDYFTRINGSDGKYNYETHVNENATYYAYTIDNTGNISNRETMVINNIDTSGPEPFANYNSNKPWTNDETLTVGFGCQKDAKNDQTGCADKVTYSVYDISNGYESPIVKDVTVNARSVSYTFKVDIGKNMRTARIRFTIWDNLGHSTNHTYDIPVKIDRVTPDIAIDIDKSRDSGWFGLVTYGYNYYFTLDIKNSDKIISGIKTAGFWQTGTKLEEFEKDPNNPYWDSVFGNSTYWSTYVSKGSEIRFAGRAVTGAGTPRFATAVATGKGCTDYAGSAVAGGALGATGTGLLILGGILGGPAGWLLAGGGLLGAIFGAGLCAAN